MKPEVVHHPQGDRPPKATLYYGADVRETLRMLPDNSVHMVCTSPPYWGLRDYGLEPSIWGGDSTCDHAWTEHEVIRKGSTNGLDGSTLVSAGAEKTTAPSDDNDRGQYRTDTGAFCSKCRAWKGCLGLEPDHKMYVAHMVEIMAEVWRVLRMDGTLWLNLGDTYGGYHGNKQVPDDMAPSNKPGYTENMRKSTVGVGGLKQKDLAGIPWRVALALQDAGWYLRSDIIWSKRNPMPESVNDRPTKAHEYIFMLTKKPRYFYDSFAVREDASENKPRGFGDPSLPKKTDSYVNPGGHTGLRVGIPAGEAGRNCRSVWTVSPDPYAGAHFATWPPKLVELMVKAGTSEWGCCPTCGAPWERIVERGATLDLSYLKTCGADSTGGYHGDATKDYESSKAQNAAEVKKRILAGMRDRKTAGWQPTCQCPNREPLRAVVMDIFSGSGTTGMVALQLGRDYIGIDANPEYLSLAKARVLDTPAPQKDQTEDTESVLDIF